MKRILSILCLALCTAAAWAADGVTLGYCNGQVVRSSDIRVEGETWVHAAILLTPDMLGPYAGGQLTTVRVGLAARTNIDNVRAWVRSALDSDDLAWGELDAGQMVRGWNEIELESPHRLEGTDGALYVGFSYQQRAASAAISVVDGSHEGAFFLRPGDAAAWEDRSGEGLLSLEAVVTADNLVGYDLQLLSADARHNAQGGIELTAMVHNNGSQPVSGYTLTATVAGSGEQLTEHIDQPLANGASTTLSLTLQPQTEGTGKQHALTLDISSLDGGATDERPENNGRKVVFTYQRRVLIEEFTNEACTSCPKGAKALHDALDIGNNASRSALMAHHSVLNDDFLTFRPADVDYEWFFNHPKAVYAPSLMFDRVAQEASYGTDTYMTPVVDPSSAELIAAALSYFMARPAHSYLSLRAEGEETLNVTVSGGRSQEFGLTPTRLTICLVEDHIAQREQVSMNQWPEFEHTGALRAINSTWGEPVEWTDDNQFEATCQFTLSPEWVRENLRVIAFLSDYDPTDPTRCEVDNSEQLSLDGTSAIAQLPHATPGTSIFTLDGKRSGSLRSGVNLIRQTQADGSTRTIKIIK